MNMTEHEWEGLRNYLDEHGIEYKTEHERRWEAMSKQIDKEYNLAWVKLVVYILAVAASIAIGYFCV